MMDNQTASLKAATSLMTLSRPDHEPSAIEVYTKNAITKLKASNVTEKNELQKLNNELRGYLENVRALEAMNKNLIAEVDRAKSLYAPKEMDKSQLDRDLENGRLKLEDESNAAVKHQARIDESEQLIQHLNQRIKFFQNESELQKQKINNLVANLNDFKAQRDNLLRSAQLAEDDISRERAKQEQSERDLGNLRTNLKENRVKNKTLEFEIQTLLDELAFRKAVFNDEITELRSRPSGILNPVDLNNFYKNELVNAVRQIRQDFQALGEQQLKDYKDHKENELALVINQVEQDRAMAEQSRSRLDANKDLEMQSARELKSTMNDSQSEIGQLNAKHSELISKLSSLESRLEEIRAKNMEKLEKLQAEIDLLKQQNDSYASDVDYWDRFTRTKLESEIQTYRSILNCQIKLMQNSTLSYEGTKTKANPVTSVNMSAEEKAKADAIAILRQVFNYFDSDNSGSVNSRELDQILKKLDIKLSQSTYNEILREFDRDSSRDINFNEFCRIMLPVFTGKFDDEELWYAFKKFDADNSGHITVSELKQILSKIGQNFTDREIEAMIATVDSNFDGKLSFKEFSRLMKSPAMK